MTYPLAPWRLKGYGFLALYWIDVARVRSAIPDPLQICTPLPGKTIGCVYVGMYEAGSTLQYGELIVASALVVNSGKIGTWISQICVDNSDSQAGGREIWGLPKEMAQFELPAPGGDLIQVKQDDRLLCQVQSHWHLPGIAMPLQVPAFSVLNSQLVDFKGSGKIKWHWAGIDVHIPLESPIAKLGLGQPFMTVFLSSLDLSVEAPALTKTVASQG
jgi:acetoacetate decarboxylase